MGTDNHGRPDWELHSGADRDQERRDRADVLGLAVKGPRWTKDWLLDTGVLLTSQIALSAVAAALSILLARSLGPEDFGVFSSFLALSQAFAIFVDAGLTVWVLRELSHLWSGSDSRTAPERAGTLLASSVALNVLLGTGLVVASVAVALALSLSTYLVACLAGLMAYFCLLAGSSSLEGSLRAKRRMGLVVTAMTIEKTVLVALVVASLAAGFGLLGIAAAHVAAGFSRLGFDYVKTAHLLSARKKPLRWRDVTSSLGLALPFGLNTLAFNFVPRLDIAVVAVFSTVSASYFALGYQIVTTLILIPVIASSTLYPFLARSPLERGGVWRLALIMGTAGLGVAALGFAAAPFLVPAVFGDSYSTATEPIQVMLWALPWVFATNALMAALYSRGFERRVLKTVLPLSVAGSVALAIGQSVWGSTGAAIGFTLRYLLFCLALIALAARTTAPASADDSTAATDWQRVPRGAA